MIKKAGSDDEVMVFVDEEHYAFYVQTMKRVIDDAYRRALIYTIGIDEATRLYWEDLYDQKTQRIKFNAINAFWQGNESRNITRLAFQLFSDRPITAICDGNGNVIQDFDECRRYSVSDIFDSNYALYFVQAISLRYPEFFDVKQVEKIERMCKMTDAELRSIER